MTARRDLTDPTRAVQRADLEAGLKPPLFESIEIPEQFGPVDVLVDDFKVKRFAFVTDDFHPWMLGDASPFGERVAHPAILANDLLQMFTLRYAPSQVVGLHTEEEMWFDRPIPVGATVTLSAKYVETYVRRGQGHVVMEAAATDAAGHTFVRHRGVEIMRTVPGDVAGRGSAGPSTSRRPVTDEYDASLPTVQRMGRGVAPGMRLAPHRREITLEQMAVFSRVGEFVRNIHNDLGIAREGGLDVPIVQGQQLYCLAVSALMRAFGATWFTGGHLVCKFLKPISAFETIEVSGAVQGIRDELEASRVDVDVWLTRSDGSIAMVGWADAELPDGPAQALLA